MLADLKYAWRQLVKSPGFALTAVLTLALGIGANTAIYSIIHGALRLPYPYANRMVAIQNVYPQGSYYAVSYPDFLEWRDKAHSFAQLVARFPSRVTWVPSGFGKTEPEAVDIGLVSNGFFRMFGMQPILGRDFIPSEHQKGGAPACVLAEGFWRQQLNANPGVVGRSLDLDGKPCTIVGVVSVFRQPQTRPAQLWLPLEPNRPFDQHGTNYLFANGLLRPGTSEAQALAELTGIQAQIDRQFPGNAHGIAVHPLAQAIFGDLHSLMLVLLTAVGFILLIACVNLANMLLARASDRSREFAVRRALGATAFRMVRQTLTESLLLSLGGAGVGLVVAFALTHIPIAAWPKGFVPPSEVHLDASVLAFTALLGISTGILFGLFPALRIVRQQTSALQPGRSMTDSRGHSRTRAVLVIAEIALSMLLVAGALNMAIYFLGLLHADSGVNPANAMAMTVQLSPGHYAKPDDQRRFFQQLRDRLSALPGVAAVGGSVDIPFTGANANGDFHYEGQPNGTADRNPFAEKHSITPGFFAALGTPVQQGRDFTNQDTAGSQKVVILNRGMVRKLWPGQNPIGKHVNLGDGWATVIGVVADIRFSGPAQAPAFQIYQSIDQAPADGLAFVLRTSNYFSGDPLALAEPARRAVASIDPQQAVGDITSLAILSDESIAGQRTSALVTAILGCLALLLASIGVYGVMAYSVSRREREFGIRIALGSDRGRILRLLFSSVWRMVFAGVLLGGIFAIAARVWIESLLGGYGNNTAALLLAGALLSTVAMMAALIPARSAMNVEPMVALRNE